MKESEAVETGSTSTRNWDRRGRKVEMTRNRVKKKKNQTVDHKGGHSCNDDERSLKIFTNDTEDRRSKRYSSRIALNFHWCLVVPAETVFSTIFYECLRTFVNERRFGTKNLGKGIPPWEIFADSIDDELPELVSASLESFFSTPDDEGVW